MSFSNPAHTVTRWSVVGMEGMWSKMFDPPTESNMETPDFITPTNPVPEVLFNAGYQTEPATPHTIDIELMHGIKLDTWDLRPNKMMFFLFNNPDLTQATGNEFPSATMRMPQGVIFHAKTDGKGPPPHTIHWHGMEPTTINDGVGHCSMEIGSYTYQWQPNFMGSYFAHCHRNTVQHFEFGLYFLLLIEPRDAYFATQANPAIPIGHCRDGKRRTAANLASFPQFPGWNSNQITDPDPWVPDPQIPWTSDPRIMFEMDPHANTVPYDVEALWVMDDRDSTWSDLAPDARATFPRTGNRPGFDDEFNRNPGGSNFFAFNDYHADYWYVTGVPVPTYKGGTASIPGGIVIPPGLNSGISGSQVSINAYAGQTILLRNLNGAYNSIKLTLPVDVVVIAWDGRALGVMPYGHNNAYLVPAGTPIYQTTARRFDGLIKVTEPVNSYAVVEFINNRGENVPGNEEVVCTAHVPFSISPINVAAAPSLASPQTAGTSIAFTASMPGTLGSQVPTSGDYEYQFWLKDTSGSYSLVQPYSTNSVWNWVTTGLPAGAYSIAVQIRPVGANLGNGFSDETVLNYVLLPAVTQTLDVTTQANGTDVTFTATAGGGTAPYEYRFWLKDLSGNYSMAQEFSTTNSWNWSTLGLAAGVYSIAVQAKSGGSTPANGFEVEQVVTHTVAALAATSLDCIVTPSSPQNAGTQVSFDATASGGSGPYEYRFWIKDTSGVYTLAQGYSASKILNWVTTSLPAGRYSIAIQARTVGSSAGFDVERVESYDLLPVPAQGVGVASQTVGNSVAFIASPIGGTAPHEYQFWLKDLNGVYAQVQAFSLNNIWNWDISGLASGTYSIAVQIRSLGSLQPAGFDAESVVNYQVP